MKVLFVVNSLYASGNGLSASARRTIDTLLKYHGDDIEIKVLSQKNPDADGKKVDFEVNQIKLPIFNNLVNKQGYSFGKAQKDVITKAVKWADLIHIEEPFWLEKVTCDIAKKQNVPLTGTYHLHPENLFCSVHLGRSLFLNGCAMLWFRNNVFNHLMYLQCPTENVKNRLVKWHYKAKLEVISNGIIPHGNSMDNKLKHDIFTIVCTGRYSVEKDQLTLLKALKYSKHAKEMKVILAGRGPLENALRKKADWLLKKDYIKYPISFEFHTQEELLSLYRKCDLYIHCAIVEVEGLSCTEALSMGVVPIIASGKLTATSQFALSEKSIFKAGNYKELASKIDYFFENREELEEESKKYLSIDKNYDIKNSVEQIYKMYKDTLKNWNKRGAVK